jgi:hypothetical protein
MMILMALSSIAIEKTKVTEKTMGRCIQSLDYFATNEMAKIRFYASEIILNIHFDVSYLSETGALSRACGHFSMGWCQKRTNQYG